MGRTAHLCEPQESSFPDGKRLQPRESRSPYHLRGPVTEGTQSVVFNAVPLLVLATAYLVVAATLVPTLWRERAQARLADVAVVLMFPALAVMAIVWAAVVFYDRSPIGGHVWPPFAAIVIGLVPPALILARWRERRLLAAGPMLARVAEARSSLRDRELDATAALSNTLARTHEAEGVARAFLETVADLFDAAFAGLSLVSEDNRQASGFLARFNGEDADWWQEIQFDLEREPSGVASAVFEAAPVAVFDVEASPRVSQRLVKTIGAKSAAYVPLITRERVVGVLSLATTGARRAFTSEELALLQALASETATALDRAQSSAALGEALERERLVATISRRLRAELDLDSVLSVAVEESGRALGVSRCFVRLVRGGGDSAMPVAAEWHEADLPSLDVTGHELPASNLAARTRETVAVADVHDASALADPQLGRIELLHELGVQAVLATPIIVADELIGVFALHRAEAGAWSAGEISLAEAVAHELGLAVHVTRLLEQNRERIGQQGALLRAAQVLTGDLELERVLQRLADQVAELLNADAADCFLFDEQRGVLRCAAVHGLPKELVGFEFPVDRGLAALAIREGRPVVARSYEDLTEPVPHDAYAEFTDAVVAPMRWSDDVQGVLGVGLRDGRRHFTQSEADVLEAFAGLASLALRNAETFTHSTRQARVQRGFYRIASVLGQSLSRAATLDAVAQAASEALGGRFSAVLISTAGRAGLAGSFELPKEIVGFLEGGLPEQSLLARAASERRILAAPLVAGDDRFSGGWADLAA